MIIYALLDDKKKVPGCRHIMKRDDDFFAEENDKGFGIFFTVNSFQETRKEESCIALRYVYADMDIAKVGDGQSREQKQEKKEKLKKALIEYCEPTIIIDTSNGLQPLWKLADTDVQKKDRYVRVLKGIRAWGKDHGSAGDHVYDVARILRLPGFYHHKEQPYLCMETHKSGKTYSYDELEAKFPYHDEPTIKTAPANTYHQNPINQAIDVLDFQELMIRAFGSAGRVASFDKQGRLILDGRLTGTFQGKKGDRQYLASTSHEPFKGNKITAVADILSIPNKEARKWIIDEYNISPQKEQTKQIVKVLSLPVTPIDETVRYTWGTRELDTHVAIIKQNNFIVLGSKRGSGKTTFAFDMAMKNARDLGHKVLFISLEMEESEILDDIARKYAGITVLEEFDCVIPDRKKEAFDRKQQEIKAVETLLFRGIRRAEGVTWEAVETIINEQPVDIVFLDNLDLIAGVDGEDDTKRQKRITAAIMRFTSLHRVPVVLIHHYRKTGKTDQGMDELAGSGKIADNADRVVRIVKNFLTEATFPDKYASEFYLQKGRGYPEVKKTIYFIKGTFVDIPPLSEDHDFVRFQSPSFNSGNPCGVNVEIKNEFINEAVTRLSLTHPDEKVVVKEDEYGIKVDIAATTNPLFIIRKS